MTGTAAMEAEARKRNFCNVYIIPRETYPYIHSFAPVAVETLGVWGMMLRSSWGSWGGSWLRPLKTPARSPSLFLRQRVDVAVQRGNALSIMGTFLFASLDLDTSLK